MGKHDETPTTAPGIWIRGLLMAVAALVMLETTAACIADLSLDRAVERALHAPGVAPSVLSEAHWRERVCAGAWALPQCGDRLSLRVDRIRAAVPLGASALVPVGDQTRDIVMIRAAYRRPTLTPLSEHLWAATRGEAMVTLTIPASSLRHASAL